MVIHGARWGRSASTTQGYLERGVLTGMTLETCADAVVIDEDMEEFPPDVLQTAMKVFEGTISRRDSPSVDSLGICKART